MHKSIFAAAILLTIALGPSALAATYYVASHGNDSNAGTRQAPFATIAKAGSVAVSGDTVDVEAGGYALAPFRTAPATVTYRCTDVSGNLDRGACKLQPANGTANSAILWENDGGGVVIDGFELDGRTPDGTASVRIGFYSSPTTAAAPVIYQYNVVHNLYQYACGSGGAGLYSDAYHVAGAVVHFLQNVVHDIGPSGGCNLVHNIYLGTIGDAKNNLVWNTSGWGIATWHDARDNHIVNNTVFTSHSGGISVGTGEWYHAPIPWSGSVRNNIVVNNPGTGIGAFGSVVARQPFTNNLVEGNGTNLSLDGQTAIGTVTTAPQFVAYSPGGAGDYHLQAGSAGIDQGTATDAPAIDFDGHARPSGARYDIGAYEYVTYSCTYAAQPAPGFTITCSAEGGAARDKDPHDHDR